MSRSSLLLGFLLSAAGLAGLSTAALAGGTAGRVGQVGPVTTGVGAGAGSGFGTSQPLNVSVQPSAPEAGTIVPVTTSPNTLNVQTNIDNTRTIEVSNTIAVNDTVNGSNVSYGGNGASMNWPQNNALNVIDGMANFNASISANTGLNVTALTDALETAQFLGAQGN